MFLRYMDTDISWVTEVLFFVLLTNDIFSGILVLWNIRLIVSFWKVWMSCMVNYIYKEMSICDLWMLIWNKNWIVCKKGRSSIAFKTDG